MDEMTWSESTAPIAVSTAKITVSPVITTVSQPIIAPNPDRKGLTLYNNSANTVYCAYAPTTITTSIITFQIATFASWTMPDPVYTGVISGIRNSGTGTVIATELTL